MRGASSLTAVFFLFSSLLAAGQSERKPGLQLRLFGGATQHLLGDLSETLKGWNYQVEADPYSYIENGEFRPFHWGWELGAEATLPIGRRWRIGLGVGYIQTGKDSVRELAWRPDKLYPYEFIEERLDPHLRTIPLTLNLHLEVFSNRRLTLTAIGGLGLYLGTFNWDYQKTNTASLEVFNETWRGSASGLGCHGGLELGFSIDRRLGVFIEGMGRYAQITGYRGEYRAGNATVPGAYLWRVESGQFPLFIFSADESTGGIYVNARQPVIDLSGFSMRAGLVVRFGSSN